MLNMSRWVWSLKGHHKNCSKGGSGFTRIELLAVCVSIGLLALLLLPALASTRDETHGGKCLNNLRQIWVGIMVYADDHDGFLYTVNGNIPNGGQWSLSPRSGYNTLVNPGYGRAYWGVAYLPYVGGQLETFRCPSANMVDEWRDIGDDYPTEWWLVSSYGVSRLISQTNYPSASPPKPITRFVNPTTVIAVQDAAEQAMEGPDDSLGLFPGQSQILTQWIGTPPPYGGLSGSYYNGYPFEWEWYRYDKKCYTLWLSGHVSKIPFNGLNQGIDYRYYTGETPELPLPGE
jgi:hypothetical protein